jgi:hypothetical protein
MHAIGNAFGHPLSAEYVKVAAGMEYLGSLGNGLFFIAFALILGFIIQGQMQKKPALSKSIV